MNEDCLIEAINCLDKAVIDRIRRMVMKEGAPPAEQDLSRVALEVAALCGRLRGEYLDSEKLCFTLADSVVREYLFPSPPLAASALRSVLAAIAFVVDEILHADIPEIGSRETPKLKGLPIEEQKRRAVDFAESVFSDAIQCENEIQARGLPSANLYGFSLIFDYKTAKGKEARLLVETSNILGKPFYFDIMDV
jgi:hypothetical protein